MKLNHKNGFAIIICDIFPPDIGGMASTAFRLSKYLQVDDNHPVVLVFKPDYIRQHYGQHEKIFDTGRFLNSFNRHSQFKNNWPELIPKQAIPSFVVSLYMGRTAHFGYHLSQLLKIPHYIVCLGSDMNHQFRRFSKKWRFPILTESATGIGIISPDMKDKLLQLNTNPQKIHLIPSGFDHDIFRPLDISKQYDFLFVGRARPVKGLDRLIIALSTIEKQLHVCCVIPTVDGDQDSFVEYYKLSQKLTKHHKLTWLFNQRPDQLSYLYNSSQYLVVPSRNEGAPHVVLEAMACNCPVIASGVGRIPYFIESNKFLFNTDENLTYLLKQAMMGRLKTNINLRRRAMKIAGPNQERKLYRRFVGLEN